jgi:hypothetical protein
MYMNVEDYFFFRGSERSLVAGGSTRAVRKTREPDDVITCE